MEIKITGHLYFALVVLLTTHTRDTLATETQTEAVAVESLASSDSPPLTSSNNTFEIESFSPLLTDPTDAANQFAVTAVNQYRTDHQARALVWSKELQTQAGKCASIYRDQHDKGPALAISQKLFPVQCGDVKITDNEIIFHTTATVAANTFVIAEALRDAYVAGTKAYTNYGSPTTTVAEAQQVFTQMLWKGTQRMGCGCDPAAHVTAAPQMYVCSCIFSPGGNDRKGYGNVGLNLYKTNVAPAL